MRPSALPTAMLLVGTLAKSSSITCADGLYMVVARGTGEKDGSGVTGSLAEDIADRIENSIVEPLDYPAAFSDPNYMRSERDGVETMQNLITSYHKACPDGKIAVFGYSQGGQVASDAFCGSGGIIGFSQRAALPISLVEDSVVAIIVFGDPSHVAEAPYNRGTSQKNGVFPRQNITLCEDNYTGIMRSYCDTGDTFCDLGDDGEVHRLYISNYGDDIANFVVDKYDDMMRKTTATASGTASASASASATDDSDNAAAGLAPGLALATIAPFALTILGLLL
ncbi:hypothetical protein G7Z17_g8041 [Cylindrodendrum hubeiense]|uniref:Cutinase n=1 Tax=Cylindrodendrum hubeiense TaxID=595255 RepID=A0A9P5H7V2_9HYPO|nr:hypothetical protein G7Z17_g8041 [Cylindrodendrum hubeiense]